MKLVWTIVLILAPLGARPLAAQVRSDGHWVVTWAPPSCWPAPPHLPNPLLQPRNRPIRPFPYPWARAASTTRPSE